MEAPEGRGRRLIGLCLNIGVRELRLHVLRVLKLGTVNRRTIPFRYQIPVPQIHTAKNWWEVWIDPPLAGKIDGSSGGAWKLHSGNASSHQRNDPGWALKSQPKPHQSAQQSTVSVGYCDNMKRGTCHALL